MSMRTNLCRWLLKYLGYVFENTRMILSKAMNENKM
jgi:hypothetical protein